MALTPCERATESFDGPSQFRLIFALRNSSLPVVIPGGTNRHAMDPAYRCMRRPCSGVGQRSQSACKRRLRGRTFDPRWQRFMSGSIATLEVTNDGSSRTHTLYPPHPAIAARWVNSLAARDSGRGNSPSIGLLLGPALDPGLRADVAPRGASADGRSIDDRTTVAVLTSVRSSAG